jgi:hypothetical protein
MRICLKLMLPVAAVLLIGCGGGPSPEELCSRGVELGCIEASDEAACVTAASLAESLAELAGCSSEYEAVASCGFDEATAENCDPSCAAEQAALDACIGD